MSRLIRICTVCHSFFVIFLLFVCFYFRLKHLFASLNMSNFKDGSVHFKNSGMKWINSEFEYFDGVSSKRHQNPRMRGLIARIPKESKSIVQRNTDLTQFLKNLQEKVFFCLLNS